MSKGLKALKEIKKGGREDDDFGWLSNSYLYEEEIAIIEKELKEGEKAQFKLKALGNFVLKSKALEIINKKCSANCNLALVKDSQNYKVYNEQFDYFLKKWQEHAGAFEVVEEDRLVQEEYDLVREVLL